MLHRASASRSIMPFLMMGAISKNGFWPKMWAGTGFKRHCSGILQYVEDLELGTNTQVGPKDFFVIASNLIEWQKLW